MGQLILAGEVPYVAAHNMKLPGSTTATRRSSCLRGDGRRHPRRPDRRERGRDPARRCSRAPRRRGAALTAAAAYAVLSLGSRWPGSAPTPSTSRRADARGRAAAGAPDDAGRERRASLGRALAGLFLGVLMKQPGVRAFGAFGAAARGARRRAGATARGAGVYAIGAVVPYASTCLALLAAGAFEPFWFWTVTYLRDYGPWSTPRSGSAAVAAAGAMTHASLPLWVLAAVGLTARLGRRGSRRPRVRVVAFVAACAAPSCRGSTFAITIPPRVARAALLVAGRGGGGRARASPARSRAAASRGAVAARARSRRARPRARLPVAALAGRERAGDVRREPVPRGRRDRALGRRHTAPADRVAVIGSEPQIYFYARRRAATSFMYIYPLMEPQPFAAGCRTTSSRSSSASGRAS